jgi:hypothetical protein
MMIKKLSSLRRFATKAPAAPPPPQAAGVSAVSSLIASAMKESAGVSDSSGPATPRQWRFTTATIQTSPQKGTHLPLLSSSVTGRADAEGHVLYAGPDPARIQQEKVFDSRGGHVESWARSHPAQHPVCKGKGREYQASAGQGTTGALAGDCEQGNIPSGYKVTDTPM